MKSFLTSLLLLLLPVSFLYAQQRDTQTRPLNIGEIRTIRSAALGEDRTLNVYLPLQYDPAKAYPVLYLLDGSLKEDFLHITGLVQFYGMQFKMPEFIIVGIANVDRKRDFTFHTERKDLKESFPTTGHSDAFIRFLETELLPYISAAYKTTDTRYLIGQSLGGLLATEILLKKPQLFSHYFIVSPSLWWDDESLLKEAKSLVNGGKGKAYVYISVGGKEDPAMQREAAALSDVLRDNAGLDVHYLPLPEENHATILHQSISEAFKLLFPYRD